MVVTLTGNNEYQIKSELSVLVDDFSKSYGDLAIETFESDSTLDKIMESINNVGLWSSDKLIIFRSMSENKLFAERLEDIIKDVPEGTSLVFVEPNLDKRGVFYKLLKRLSDFKQLDNLKDIDQTNWIVSYVVKDGGRISSADARYLTERAGNSQLGLANELDKLLLYNKNISKETIDLLVEDNYQNNVFQLIDAAFNNKLNTAIKIFSNLRAQKIESPQIIAMLVWQLNVLAILKYAGNKNSSEVSSDAKLNPFVLNKNRAIANKISSTQLKKIISQLLNIDIASKSDKTDVDEALSNFILDLASS